MKLGLVISLFFHAVLFLSFYYSFSTNRIVFKDALWASGDGITYVDLGTLGNEDVSGDDEASVNQDTEKKTTTKTSIKKVKEAKGKKKGKASSQKNVASGGVDQAGVISKSAPNALAQIRKQIALKKNYPRIAKDREMTGQVKVGFKLKASGELEYVKVLKSSGYGVLDKAAIESVKRAAPFPFYPDPIQLSLEYRLD